MLFSSATFLFLFLPIVCAVYFLVRREMRNYVLLIASMLFYAWGGALMLGRNSSRRRLILAVTIIADLGMLGYFKYFNFLFSGLVGPLDIIMPIGISFYTFQAISYVVDVYRGTVAPQRDIYKLALYICLFPQLIAGPIVKYHDVDSQLSYRTENIFKITYGVQRFIIGFAKKMLVANTLGAVADRIFALPVDQFDVFVAWLGAAVYRMQVFFDFSGYSDMAIGLGAIFGFKFLENFNYPYISKSISEFWRRWHISLSSWFKQYLYFPLGGSRFGQFRTCINLMIVFIATGIWHGAAWTFIVWGLWNGIFIVIERISGFYKRSGGWGLSVLQHVYAILIFGIAGVIFRADTLSYAWNYIKHMFGFVKAVPMFRLSYFMDNFEWIILGVAFVCATPVFRKILPWARARVWRTWMVNVWLIVLLVLSASQIAASTYNPFIYFRF